MTTTSEPATATAAATLQGVTKVYPHFRLHSIDLNLERGAVHGLIGPNGAGKSTTMRILMGLVQPDSGSVQVLGQPISSHESGAKQEIGYFSEDMRLYKGESLAWHMQLVRSLFPSWDDEYAAALLHRFGLIAGQTIKGLSHGQRVKAMLLLLLARHPQLLILDEPTNGLDPVAKQEVLSELMRVVTAADRTILYSSHNTQDVELISDSLTFIDRGRVVATAERDLFLERWRRIKLAVPADWRPPALAGLRVDSTLGQFRVLSTDRFDESLPAQLAASGATLEALETMSLEEIFIQAVHRGRGSSET